MLTSPPIGKISSRKPAAEPLRPASLPLASEAFERQVRATPNASAIAFPGGACSYAQLDASASALARRLVSLGVGPDCLVGVACERSREMIVSLLAVLKAGGAFLPFDPHYPCERLEFMFADAQPTWCLTHASLIDALPLERKMILWRGGDGLVVVGRHPPPIGHRGTDDPPAHPFDRDRNTHRHRLAYAIYTSGSTGRPKAALLTQVGLANLVAAQRELLRLVPGRRVLQFASLAFDAAVWEIFGALTSGATLVLADQRDLLPGERLRRTIEREIIDTLTLPPSVLSMLGKPDLATLETMIVAGEACSGVVASQWSRGRRLINAYGPTEATVCATYYECPSGEQPAPPIGAALSGVELLVLDRQLRPVAAGEEGELCIAGNGLARGYLNRPELTAEKFIRHPLVRHHDGRLYRTGDLVRLRDDGQLEFLGRLDRQVKIRGVRIELDEVSAALERHPAVRAAVTLATRARPPRLASFALCRPGEGLTSVSLRDWLCRGLPAAMIPASITFVDRWPRLPNGKLDESALLALPTPHSAENVCQSSTLTGGWPCPAVTVRGERPGSRSSLRVAGNRDLQEFCYAICDLFRQVLQTPHAGPGDDFFELGGDSLRAMELLIQIEQRCGRRITLSQFLRCSTPEALARCMKSGPQANDSTLVPFEAKGSGPPLFLVHPAGGSVVCYRALASALGGQQPCYGIQSPALVKPGPPPSSIEAMAERYLDDVLRVEPSGECLLAGWSLGGLVAYEMAHRLRAAGRRPRALVLIDSGVLFSFHLLRQFVPTGEVPAFLWKAADRERMYAHICRHAGHRLFSADTEDALSRQVFDVFWANVEAAYHYSPPDYDGAMTLINGAQTRGKYHPLREWRQRCKRVHSFDLPGKHLDLLQPPCVEKLADIIRSLACEPGLAPGHRKLNARRCSVGGICTSDRSIGAHQPLRTVR